MSAIKPSKKPPSSLLAYNLRGDRMRGIGTINLTAVPQGKCAMGTAAMRGSPYRQQPGSALAHWGPTHPCHAGTIPAPVHAHHPSHPSQHPCITLETLPQLKTPGTSVVSTCRAHLSLLKGAAAVPHVLPRKTHPGRLLGRGIVNKSALSQNGHALSNEDRN